MRSPDQGSTQTKRWTLPWKLPRIICGASTEKFFRGSFHELPRKKQVVQEAAPSRTAFFLILGGRRTRLFLIRLFLIWPLFSCCLISAVFLAPNFLLIESLSLSFLTRSLNPGPHCTAVEACGEVASVRDSRARRNRICMTPERLLSREL